MCFMENCKSSWETLASGFLAAKKIYVLNYSWHFEQCFHNHQQLWLFRIHLGKTKALTSDLEFSV